MDRDDGQPVDLRTLFEAYRTRQIPRTAGKVDLHGAEVDLYEEDGYLAGLVDRFLATGDTGVDVIVVKQDIDARLLAAEPRTPEATAIVQRFREYRQAMIALAEALSSSASVPLIRSESG